MKKETIESILHKNIVELGIQDSKIRDEAGITVKKATIIDMMTESTWMPVVMIKADEICTIVTGKRLFSCAYDFNEKTLTGMSLSNLDTDVLEEYGYSKTNENINSMLIDKIVKLAITKSITISNDYAALNETRGLYSQNENDTHFRPLNDDLLFASALSNYVEENKVNIDNAFKNNNTQELAY